MYTQIRGWLNVLSIGGPEDTKELADRLPIAKATYRAGFPNLDRTWVADDTHFHIGGNGSCWLFIGTELKNYDASFDEWLNHLLTYYPTAEGRIELQCEGSEGSTSRIIKDGLVQGTQTEHAWAKGYGNGH